MRPSDNPCALVRRVEQSPSLVRVGWSENPGASKGVSSAGDQFHHKLSSETPRETTATTPRISGSPRPRVDPLHLFRTGTVPFRSSQFTVYCAVQNAPLSSMISFKTVKRICLGTLFSQGCFAILRWHLRCPPPPIRCSCDGCGRCPTRRSRGPAGVDRPSA